MLRVRHPNLVFKIVELGCRRETITGYLPGMETILAFKHQPMCADNFFHPDHLFFSSILEY